LEYCHLFTEKVKLGLIFVNSFSIIVDNFEYRFPQLVNCQTVKPLNGQFYTFITKTADYKSVEMFVNSDVITNFRSKISALH